jgi:DNA-binding response OmpR family regulator
MVLVLEDHASIGGLIAGLLREEGYRIVRAWDPQEAIRLARSRPPDLVLLDLSLTYESGLTPLQALQHDDATRRLPVLMVAAAGAVLASGDEKLVQEVVRKPFDIDVMLNAVRKALGDPLVEIEPRQFDAQDYFLNGY